MLMSLFFACASPDVAWALQATGVTVTDEGVDGATTWSFLDAGWGNAAGDGAFVCARAQSLSGTTAAPLDGCGLHRRYTLRVGELGTDCLGAEADDPAYSLPVAIAIGPVPGELVGEDPHPDRSLGWYASFDGVSLTAYGYAYDSALDTGGDVGPPGWNVGQSYTLSTAYVWDVSGS